MSFVCLMFDPIKPLKLQLLKILIIVPHNLSYWFTKMTLVFIFHFAILFIGLFCMCVC